MVSGLVSALAHGSELVENREVQNSVADSASFLLSQLALAGPEMAAKIAHVPGLTEACAKAMSSSESESTALLVNNLVNSVCWCVCVRERESVCVCVCTVETQFDARAKVVS